MLPVWFLLILAVSGQKCSPDHRAVRREWSVQAPKNRGHPTNRVPGDHSRDRSVSTILMPFTVCERNRLFSRRNSTLVSAIEWMILQRMDSETRACRLRQRLTVEQNAHQLYPPYPSKRYLLWLASAFRLVVGESHERGMRLPGLSTVSVALPLERKLCV
jgi:hypothetical protein